MIGYRSLWLLGTGALGALAFLGVGKMSKKVRPVVVGAVREGMAFSDWAVTRYEKVKEDIEDIVAEAKHAHNEDRESKTKMSKKEEEILRKLEEILQQKSGKEEV